MTMNKPTVASILEKVNALALKSPQDFDKYEALALAEQLVRIASISQHEKANFYSVGLQEIRSRMEKPPIQFKAYFLTIFSDKHYSRITESLNKVEKSFEKSYRTKQFREPFRQQPRRSMVCFRCGRPFHMAVRCRTNPYQAGPRDFPARRNNNADRA